ncbi:MAG: hypothetical protein K2K19_12655 [Acetatifactor sp.]|nr:hypothetical protein [Acetatifactor sp.]
MDKKLIAFCVGASPIEGPEVEQALERNFKDPEFRKVSAFYCLGGLNYEKMSAPSRLMMKLLLKTHKSKKDKTEAEQDGTV